MGNEVQSTEIQTQEPQYKNTEIFSGETPEQQKIRAEAGKKQGGLSARLQSILGRKNETQDPSVLSSLESEKQRILREKMRTSQLGKLQFRGSKETQEILSKRTNFESIKASDISYLRTQGVDLVPLLLVDTKDPLGIVSADTLKE